MKKRTAGALPDFHIKRLIELGHIENVDPLSKAIQPASLDLTVGNRIFKTKGSALPRGDEHMEHYRKSLDAVPYSFDDPLEPDQTYLVEIREKLNLPLSVNACVNPKSSTGRADLLTRLISNGESRYDGIRKGYRGALWVIVSPKSFRTKIGPGDSLNQIRFFTGTDSFTSKDLVAENHKCPLVWDVGTEYPIPLDMVADPGMNGQIVMCADLSSGLVGWRAKKTKEVLDFSSRDLDPELFWDRAEPKKDMLFLDKDSFWILSSAEGIVVPPGLCAEVVAMNEQFVEGRMHSAGFIDPGWGWRKGRMADTITMEVRPFEDMFLRHRLPFAGLRYRKMLDVPKRLYGVDSNYGGQLGASLAKFFRKAS